VQPRNKKTSNRSPGTVPILAAKSRLAPEEKAVFAAKMGLSPWTKGTGAFFGLAAYTAAAVERAEK
jgi:hypothetical protein